MELLGGKGVPQLARDGVSRPAGNRVNDSYIPAEQLSHVERVRFCRSVRLTLTVVRDPFDRLVSGYLGKIATDGGGGEFDRQRLRKHFQLGRDQTPTFLQFLRYVVQGNTGALNIHWRPATLLCGLGRLRYSHVLPFEALNRWLPWLAAVVRRNVSSLSAPVVSASKCIESAARRAGCASAAPSVAQAPDLHSLLSNKSERLHAFFSVPQLVRQMVPSVEHLYAEDLAFVRGVNHSWRYASPIAQSMLSRQRSVASTRATAVAASTRGSTRGGGNTGGGNTGGGNTGGGSEGGRLDGARSALGSSREMVRKGLGGVCIGVKHMSRFRHRREKLQVLLDAVILRARHAMVLVADDLRSDAVQQRRWAAYWAQRGVHYLIQPTSMLGLAAGRNFLAAACNRTKIFILDDDYALSKGTRFEEMAAWLDTHPKVGLVAGCYESHRHAEGVANCYAFDLAFDSRRREVKTSPITTHLVSSAKASRAHAAHLVHNFFVARVDVLRRFPWDPRMKMLEHEPFFIQLWRHGIGVVVMPTSTILHDHELDEQYSNASSRMDYDSHMQYTCKDFPGIRSFRLPYVDIHCHLRRYCRKYILGQPPPPGECKSFSWNDTDDTSALVAKPPDRQPPVRAFFAVPSHQGAARNRGIVRSTWLGQTWQHSTDWAYRFFIGVQDFPGRLGDIEMRAGDVHEMGDVVRLNVSDNYEQLAHKVVAIIQWVARHVHCQLVIKLDDDTYANVDQLLAFAFPDRFIGGSVQLNSQPHRREEGLGRFSRWVVDNSTWPNETYPPYTLGGGYLLGTRALSMLAAHFASGQALVIPNLEGETTLPLTSPWRRTPHSPSSCPRRCF